MTASRVLFSFREAAKQLNLRRDRVSAMVKDGRIRTVDVEGTKRVPLVEIERIRRQLRGETSRKPVPTHSEALEALAKTRRRAQACAVTKLIREAVHAASDGTCALCGTFIDDEAPAVELRGCVDHIVPVAASGSDAFENLRWVHALCNQRRGKRDSTLQEDPRVYVVIGLLLRPLAARLGLSMRSARQRYSCDYYDRARKLVNAQPEGGSR